MTEVTSPVVVRLAAFCRTLLADVWGGSDPDGGDIQALAVKHGLIREVLYDPTRHPGVPAAEFGIDPGDPIYVLADDVKGVRQP